MRAKEFIVERRQVNEAFPILAYISASLASMSALSLMYHVLNVGIGLWQANDTWNEYKDKAEIYGDDIFEWPPEEQDLIVDALLMAFVGSVAGGLAPWVVRGIKGVFSNIPKEVKQEAMKKVAPKIEAELKKVVKKDAPAPGTTAPAPGTKVTKDAPGTTAPAQSKVTPSDIEKDKNRIMGANSDKQAELKAKLSGKPETPQEKLKRELLAKQAAKAK